MAAEIAHGFEWFTLEELPRDRVQHIIRGVEELSLGAPARALRFRRISVQPEAAVRAIANSRGLGFDLMQTPRVADVRSRQVRYIAAYKAGELVDPIVVYSLGSNLTMVDGYIRLHAAREAGVGVLDAYTLRPTF
jgi:hypothetical protein